jgi:hypothetical protein
MGATGTASRDYAATARQDELIGQQREESRPYEQKDVDTNGRHHER